MKVYLVFGLMLCCTSYFVKTEDADCTGRQRRISVVLARARIRRNRGGTYSFPDDIEYTLDIEGMGRNHFRAKKVKNANKKPKIMTVEGGRRFQWRRKAEREIEYYTNANGSFACKLFLRNRQPECDLMGIIHDAKQSCFIKRDKAFCEEKIEGTSEVINLPDEPVPTVPYPGNHGNRSDFSNQRGKRRIVELDSGVRVIQIAFFLDAAFIARFSRINPNNIEAARDDAEMYITMVANEITYRYQTVKDLNINFRGGVLDLAVNPKMILYPETGDFSFLVKDSQYLYSSTLNRFRNFVNSEFQSGDFDHAMLVSGLNLYSTSPSLLGSAYLSSVCATNNNRFYKVSMNEDRDFSLANIGAHELGHALGAQHDSAENPCTSSGYIMAAFATRPTTSTQDTIFTFSRCSGEYFATHLLRFPDCLSSQSVSKFRENFCSGPRGLRGASFDYQCQNYYSYGPSYTECYNTRAISASGCYRPNAIYCYPGSGGFCYGLPYLADGSPCIGPNSAKSYYCYLGDCIEEDEICPTSQTTAPTPPPTTPPPPPTSPPTTSPPPATPSPPPLTTSPPPTTPPPPPQTTSPPPMTPPPPPQTTFPPPKTSPPPPQTTSQPPTTPPPPPPTTSQPPTTPPPPPTTTPQPPPSTAPPPTITPSPPLTTPRPPPTTPSPPSPTTPQYCYLGDCVEEDTICPDSGTNTPPPTTRPPPTPPPCTCDSIAGYFLRLICCRRYRCC